MYQMLFVFWKILSYCQKLHGNLAGDAKIEQNIHFHRNIRKNHKKSILPKLRHVSSELYPDACGEMAPRAKRSLLYSRISGKLIFQKSESHFDDFRIFLKFTFVTWWYSWFLDFFCPIFGIFGQVLMNDFPAYKLYVTIHHFI